MVYYGDEESGYKHVRERKRPENIDYSQPAKSVERALETLMATCARSERCISDIRRSLYRWRMRSEDYEPIIRQLVEERFVDEERYARLYVRDKANAGWGKRKIELGLKAKGIPADIITAALQEMEPKQQAEQLETLLYRRKLREASKAKTPYELRTRLFRWAAGRGYDFSEIDQVLERILSDRYEPDETITRY